MLLTDSIDIRLNFALSRKITYFLPVVTVSWCLPLALLLLSADFPPGLDILFKNPCFRSRLTFFGCQVLLLIFHHLFNTIRDIVCTFMALKDQHKFDDSRPGK
jgi:hypothetical protein